MLRNTWKANKNDPTFVQAEIQFAHVERALHGRSGGFIELVCVSVGFFFPFFCSLCVCFIWHNFFLVFSRKLLVFQKLEVELACSTSWLSSDVMHKWKWTWRGKKNTLTHTQIHRQMCGAEGKKATRIRNRITTRNMKHEHMRCSVCLFFFLSLRPLFLFPFRIRNDFVNQLKEKATVRKCT